MDRIRRHYQQLIRARTAGSAKRTWNGGHRRQYCIYFVRLRSASSRAKVTLGYSLMGRPKKPSNADTVDALTIFQGRNVVFGSCRNGSHSCNKCSIDDNDRGLTNPARQIGHAALWQWELGKKRRNRLLSPSPLSPL